MDKVTEEELNLASERLKLAKDPKNKEFWEVKLESLKMSVENMKSQLIEMEYGVQCYQDKVDSF